jgi:hypothetical protein
MTARLALVLAVLAGCTITPADSLRTRGRPAMSGEYCQDCSDTGCDITMCQDCGEDYSDPCDHHRQGGHVPCADPYDDGVACTCTCRTCGITAGGDA